MKYPGRVARVEILGRTPLSSQEPDAFLALERLTVKNRYDDGTESPAYQYDTVLRRWLDAVVLVLTAQISGRTAVCLRSCVRPPLNLRPELDLPLPDDRLFHTLWELPAGLLEECDRGVEGLKSRAVLEALEETGYRLSKDDFSLVPGAPFLSPGVMPERLYYLRAAVPDIADRTAAAGDGSVVEEGAGIWWVSVADAIAFCDTGEIADAKTELALRRLAAE